MGKKKRRGSAAYQADRQTQEREREPRPSVVFATPHRIAKRRRRKMRGRTACVVVFLLLLGLAGVHGMNWKYCDGDWEAKISNATVVPDPARAGQDINVMIDGEIGRVVEGGELDITVLFHKIPVYKETDDLCDRLDACPANGPFVVDAKQSLPSFTLPGKYQLKVTAKDDQDAKLVCMILDLEIKGPSLW